MVRSLPDPNREAAVPNAQPLSNVETADALRATAQRNGYLAEQAAVELLIRHDYWLRRADVRKHISIVDVDDDEGFTACQIGWDALWRAVDSGDISGQTGSAHRILTIAHSIAKSGVGVNLKEALSGLDSTNAALVARAILHATGLTRDAVVWTTDAPPDGGMPSTGLWDAQHPDAEVTETLIARRQWKINLYESLKS